MESKKTMSKKNKHKKSKLLKQIAVSAVKPISKKFVDTRIDYYSEDYRGFKIRVFEITSDDCKGCLEIEVDSDEKDVTWHYMPFNKDELEEQPAR